MNYYEVAPTRIVRLGADTFTYSATEPVEVGQLVRISVGSRTMNGLVLQKVAKPTYNVKPLTGIIETIPLPPAHIALAKWLSEYYVTPLATVLQTILPSGLEKKRRTRNSNHLAAKRNRTTFVLNNDQKAAITTVNNASPGTILLHGVTGSGKTAVYIELVKQALAADASAIILVPEIALTSQLIAEFSHHFKNILLTHSRQTEAQRHYIWQQALSSKSPRVVIGPRSALFMPLAKIGLIVVDEAHEPSYKQDQSPRYHASRAAHQLATFHGAKLVLGSATPLASDYYLAVSAKRPIVSMPKPAVQNTVKSDVVLIDMTKRANFKRHRFLSDTLLSQLEQTFAAGHQALIFHNRRGSASMTLCENCGWQAGCPRCFVPLTLHGDEHILRCHICGYKAKVPTSCPQCSSVDIFHKGIGTKLIESELTKLFPNQTIARFDGDSGNDETVEARYNDLYKGTIDIIIGTQVIAKGLDLPHLRTVGIVQADAGLSLPDYSSPERTFQLLAQAIGRVGRSTHATNVIVQSYQPTHPVVTTGLHQNYQRFYELALKQRKTAHFPPFTHLLKLQCVYKTEASAIRSSKALADQLRTKLPPEVEILGPTPAFYERSRDTYRWQLILKSPKRAYLQTAISLLPPQHWQFELDPQSLL